MADQGEGEISYLAMGDLANRLLEPVFRSALDALQLPEGSRGLDAGCGIGNHTLWLAEGIGPDGHVTGVDISDECLAVANEALTKSEMDEQVSFQFGDIRDLPFEDNSFDWAWSADVLYLWLLGSGGISEVARPFMDELKRVVKPGGIIALFFWSNQKLLPGFPMLEARLFATEAANFTGPYGIRPELHSQRTVGWLQDIDLKDIETRTFAVDFHAPLDDDTRKGLSPIFKMYWKDAKPEVSSEDWAEYQRLTDPRSPDYILDLPDYYGHVVYTLFYGRVEK